MGFEVLQPSKIRIQAIKSEFLDATYNKIPGVVPSKGVKDCFSLILKKPQFGQVAAAAGLTKSGKTHQNTYL